jgi:hypothetical protein
MARLLATVRQVSTRVAAPVAWALGCAGIGVAAWLLWSPQAPDLAAQVARAAVAGHSPGALWWTGWFAGIGLPTYSVLSPCLMALVGVGSAGALAVLTGSLATAGLADHARRPRTGASALALAQVADLLAGRVTFALGFAAGAWALVALRAGRRPASAVLAAATFLLSPLAGLFLGIAAAAVALTAPARRPAAVGTGLALVGLAAATAWLFPDPGTMPFSTTAAQPAVLAAVVVAGLCPSPPVRVGALLTLGATLAFLALPSAVGVNVTRLSWVVAVPVVLAWGHPPGWLLDPIAARFPGRPGLVATLVVGLAGAGVAVAPVSDLAVQLRLGGERSAQAGYYGPLNRALEAQALAGTTSGAARVGARVEVVDPANHWSSAYVAALPLARGWERQADLARNPLFYGGEPLTAVSYRAWLEQLAVGWVALPSAPLDGAAQAEAALVRSGPDYLERVWTSADWTLYRVRDPAPLTDAGRVLAVTASAVILAADGPGTLHLKLRWSPYLTLLDPDGGGAAAGCVDQQGGWVRVTVAAAGAVELTTRFDLRRRWGPAQSCRAVS